MFAHQTPSELEVSRVVVLGAGGFIGTRLIEWLSAHHIPFQPVRSTDVDLVRVDAGERLRGILRPNDSLVILSALTPERGRDRATFLKNVAMIDNMCTALADANCSHVVYVSSDSVYANQHVEITEDSCCESDDMYALSHLVREKLLLNSCQSVDLNLAILRPSAIYGAGDTHNSYGPNRFSRSAVKERKIVLFGQGEEERDHLYVDDLCRLVQLCLLRRSSGVLNAVSGLSLSFREVALQIMEVVGCDVTLETAPRQVPIVHRRFNTAGLKKAFPNFSPIPFQLGIRSALEKDLGIPSSSGKPRSLPTGSCAQ